MKHKTADSTGQAEHPRLPNGGKTVEGLARPGKGSRTVPPADDSDVGKPARPGGAQRAPSAPSTPPKTARPGGPQGINKG